MIEELIALAAQTLRLATPLLFACLAGLYSERAGIFDIGLEGKMLAAACAAASVATLSGSAWVGLSAAVAVSVMLSGLHGVASITLRGNQLISGVAINLLALGTTELVAQTVFGLGGQTPQLTGAERFQPVVLPGAEGATAGLAGIYGRLISGHAVLLYLAFGAVPLTWWVLYRTRFGLRLRAVGENPAAVDTAGISVIRLRFAAVAICGALCGFAGAYLATAQGAGFGPNMTADRGYIALAALIFAKWRPVAAMGSCLLFGFVQAIGIRYQGEAFLGITVPQQLMEALPYILTVVILAGFVGRAIPPRAGGIPYVKER